METTLSYNIYLTREETHAFYQTLGLFQHSPLSHMTCLHLPSTTCLFQRDPTEAQNHPAGPCPPWSLGRAGKCVFLCVVGLIESLLTYVVGTNMTPLSRSGKQCSERSSDFPLSHSFERANPDNNSFQTHLCPATIENNSCLCFNRLVYLYS